MTQIVDNCLKGKLKLEDFPTTCQELESKMQMKQVIVFVLGGVTYEEEKDIAALFND